MRRTFALIALVGLAVPLNAQHWTVPRTPWGDPDLQGYWPSRDMLGVPLERPARLGDRATFTDEEFAQLSPDQRSPNANDAFFGESRAHWREYGKPQRQTSLIVDPLNGRLPAMTADGTKRQASLPNEARGNLVGPQSASPQARMMRDPSGA